MPVGVFVREFAHRHIHAARAWRSRGGPVGLGQLDRRRVGREWPGLRQREGRAKVFCPTHAIAQERLVRGAETHQDGLQDRSEVQTLLDHAAARHPGRNQERRHAHAVGDNDRFGAPLRQSLGGGRHDVIEKAPVFVVADNQKRLAPNCRIGGQRVVHVAHQLLPMQQIAGRTVVVLRGGVHLRVDEGDRGQAVVADIVFQFSDVADRTVVTGIACEIPEHGDRWRAFILTPFNSIAVEDVEDGEGA